MFGAASAQFNAYINKNRNQDGAEYDAYDNRIYKSFSDPSQYQRSDDGRERRQIRRSQEQKALLRKKNRPMKAVAGRRNLRPTYDQEARATDRQGYVYNPIKQTQRQLRPVKKQYDDAPRYQPNSERYYEPARVSTSEDTRYPEPVSYAPAQPTRYNNPVKTRPIYQVKEPVPAPVKEKSYDYVRQPAVKPTYSEYQPQDQLNEVYVEPQIVDRYREPPVQKQKIFERNADVITDRDDQLEGESFQPAYTPYKPPASAYDSAYVPVEQKSIEAAVAAGAAAYPGEAYGDEKRLSFQIHGQEGPHSYRFGYDTGVGYNRQFRYEERDQYGVLHGRYGYYDQEGKLQVVNYTADPQTGFHADGEHVPKPQY